MLSPRSSKTARTLDRETMEKHFLTETDKRIVEQDVPERLRLKVDLRCYRYQLPYDESSQDWDLSDVDMMERDRREAAWVLSQLGLEGVVAFLCASWASLKAPVIAEPFVCPVLLYSTVLLAAVREANRPDMVESVAAILKLLFTDHFEVPLPRQYDCVLLSPCCIAVVASTVL
jgi:hypothetical protein